MPQKGIMQASCLVLLYYNYYNSFTEKANQDVAKFLRQQIISEYSHKYNDQQIQSGYKHVCILHVLFCL